jgi:hypothetical protein
MIIYCEHCGKKGTLDEEAYSGKKLRLQCPYCSADFVYTVPLNGNLNAESSPAESNLGRATATADEHTLDSGSAAEGISSATVSIEQSPSSQIDDSLVIEAKRIARLIISEIKLYNQEKISRAKNKREVLELLKNDLIKGKQHYNTRIASKLPIGPDYFMESVKEILLSGKT